VAPEAVAPEALAFEPVGLWTSRYAAEPDRIARSRVARSVRGATIGPAAGRTARGAPHLTRSAARWIDGREDSMTDRPPQPSARSPRRSPPRAAPCRRSLPVPCAGGRPALPVVLALPALLVLALPGIAPQPVAAGNGRLETTLSAGFDSFGERYSIDEADTLDFTSELRSIAALRYTRDWGRGHELELRNTLSLSGSSLRNQLVTEVDLVRRRNDRLTLANELAVKRFDRGDDYSVASDHVQETVRASYRAQLDESVRLRLGQRLELYAFDEPSTYEYDYRRSRTSIDLDVVRGLDAVFDVGYALAYRDVPDSTAIDYLDHEVRGDLLGYLGRRTTLDLGLSLSRRGYRDPSARPGYYLLDGSARLGMRVADQLELRLRQELELYDYDTPNDVYFSSQRHLNGVEASYEPSVDVRLGLEPRFTRHTASNDAEEYRETSVVLSGEWIRLDGLWITTSLELGQRHYREVEEELLASTGSAETVQLDDEETVSPFLYSDYDFTRVNVFATVEFARRYAFNLYLSHEPERHDDANDDTTMTLISTDITVRF
jgi:hypothetical protein